MEPIRFTDEEIKELQQLVDKTNPIKFSLGNFIDFKQQLDNGPNDEEKGLF